jgi:ribose 1,5-bisphosphokinase
MGPLGSRLRKAAETPMSRGTLFLVVGPSGAGKDTLIDGARRALAADPRFVFPRRVITRASDAGGEAHEAIDVAEFRRREERGAFALAWQAHGLHYGIPGAIKDHLAAMRHVIVNVSRAVIPAARIRFQPISIVEVWAPARVLAERLAARGRESVDDIARRIERSEAIAVDGAEVRRVENSGSVVEGVAALLSVLRAE